MFCTKCGEKINDPNQKVCPICGNNIVKISEQPQLGNKSTQSIKDYSEFSVSPKIQAEINQISKTKKFTKKCIILGLLSLAFFMFSFIMSAVMLIVNPREFPYEYNLNNIPLWVMYILVTMVISHILGLIIGIFSIKYSIKAEEKEWNSSARSFARGIAFISFFSNIIGIVFFFIFVPLLIFDVLV